MNLEEPCQIGPGYDRQLTVYIVGAPSYHYSDLKLFLYCQFGGFI